MATTSNAATSGSAGEGAGNCSNVPQWKRDLIQRRRQQSKVLANNGASNKLCNAVIGPATGASETSIGSEPAVVSQEQQHPIASRHSSRSNNLEDGVPGNASSLFSRGSPACGAIGSPGAAASGGCTVDAAAAVAVATAAASPVACNMRLEADLSLCSDSEDVANGAVLVSKNADMDRKLDQGDGSESEDSRQDAKRPDSNGESNNRACRSSKLERDVLAELARARSGRLDVEQLSRKSRSQGEDPESDSSEELQYGPGIVNKLKSKYLNLTLREMNKSRVSVQRFRRAASLEDLLDCEDEPCGEKAARKYTKRNAGGVASKSDRYRNASRGNDSMKRARSVETLMRYNAAEEVNAHATPSRPASNGLRQEPINDHIILVDRTSVKIESRLGELDRPKAVNKPKRLKPLLAETERPPPDLVKTTMRIFEGSAKKLKPKGEVAAKVATFKTINDTMKAQAQKKLLAKPPIQPKPFINGNSRVPGSPKKIVLPQKPTAELIETPEGQGEFHIDGVITDSIVQSVSSVVSKFQQFEKSQSPSPSPEPFKLKFSPVPSPEPSQTKPKFSLEINVKSPPVTPVLSPRVSSPRLQSPSSPMKDAFRQISPKAQAPTSPMKEAVRQSSSPVHKLPPPSPNRDLFRQSSATESSKVCREQSEKEPTQSSAELPKSQVSERVQTPEKEEEKEDVKACVEEKQKDVGGEIEDVDGPKTISKTALDSISKAGITMQFSFSDKSTANKSYLPGTRLNGQNGQKLADEPVDTHCITKPPVESRSKSFLPVSPATGVNSVTEPETVARLQERLEPEKCDRKIEDSKEDSDNKGSVTESKPIGAISSLGLIKSSTTTSYPQANESKTIRSPKSEPAPPPPQKQIGIIRPLVSTKTQHPQQNLSNRELEKNLINRVKSIEQPTKVVVSLKSADEIQPAKKASTGGGGGGGGLWETKPWNQQNNTMVFNFSNRKDVPDYIENDGLIIKRKREKPKVGDGGIIVLDATLDASTTDDSEWDISGGPPSPCDVSFLNDNVLINGRSNLSRTPRNHKHRIQFDDAATRTFEYPSENSMLEGESSSVDGESSTSVEQSPQISNKNATSPPSIPTLLGGGGGLASYTPSKVDLASEGFELGVTRAVSSSTTSASSTETSEAAGSESQGENESEVDYLKPAQDAGAWGSETTGDLLY